MVECIYNENPCHRSARACNARRCLVLMAGMLFVNMGMELLVRSLPGIDAFPAFVAQAPSGRARA